MATRRLSRELMLFQENPPGGATVELRNDNLLEWMITVPGPAGSFYEGGIFKILIKFDSKYPIEPPELIHKTRVFHPRFFEDSNECCYNLICKGWGASTQVTDIIKEFISLLENPNDDSDLHNSEALDLLNSDAEAFAIEVRRFYNMEVVDAPKNIGLAA